jgi:phospholipase/carboxylesterase/glyoxalase family protein
MSDQINGFYHRWLPASQPEDAPTLLMLHGTGGDENNLLALGRDLAPNANLLSPRGKVLEGSNARFFRRLAEGVFDLEDLQYRTHELADFVAEAARQYGFAEDRVIAAGYSNGANIAASMLLLRPKTLQAAVLFRGIVPLVPDVSPDLSGTKVLLTAGLEDPLVPVRDASLSAVALSHCYAQVVVLWLEAQHALTLLDVVTARDWLNLSKLITVEENENAS